MEDYLFSQSTSLFILSVVGGPKIFLRFRKAVGNLRSFMYIFFKIQKICQAFFQKCCILVFSLNKYTLFSYILFYVRYLTYNKSLKF